MSIERVAAAWRNLQNAAERALPKGVSRRGVDAWLDQCGRLRHVALVPKAMARCAPVIAVAADEKLGEIQYAAVGVDGSRLVECREATPGELGLARHTVPRFYRHKLIAPEDLFDALVRDDLDDSESGLITGLRSFVTSVLRAFDGARFPWSDPTLVADAAGLYEEILHLEIRQVFGRARLRLARLLPVWDLASGRFGCADFVNRLPVKPDAQAFNFFLDPVDGERRRQAVQTYPAAAPLLLSGAARQAVDHGRPLAPVLAAALKFSRTQVAALRSPRLGAAMATILRRQPKHYHRLLDVLRAAPPSLIPQRLDVLETALAYPEAWAVLCASLKRYTGAAVLIDGAPYIPGFHDDGDWGRDSRTRIGLGTLNDSVQWMKEAVLSALPPRLARHRTRAIPYVNALIEAHVGSRRPEQLVQLDRQLHRLAGVRRAAKPAPAEAMPRLIPDATIEGYRFCQLRTLREYAEEGSAMHHCVATYHDLAARSAYAVYTVTSSTERATLGVRLSTVVTGTLKNPGLSIEGQLDQVRGLQNAPVSVRLEEVARKWVAKLDGLLLGRGAYDAYRAAKLAENSPGGTNEWKLPLYEEIREVLWGYLPHELRSAHAGWRAMLANELDRT